MCMCIDNTGEYHTQHSEVHADVLCALHIHTYSMARTSRTKQIQIENVKNWMLHTRTLFCIQPYISMVYAAIRYIFRAKNIKFSSKFWMHAQNIDRTWWMWMIYLFATTTTTTKIKSIFLYTFMINSISGTSPLAVPFAWSLSDMIQWIPLFSGRFFLLFHTKTAQITLGLNLLVRKPKSFHGIIWLFFCGKKNAKNWMKKNEIKIKFT